MSITPQRLDELKARAQETAARARLREQRDALRTPPASHADPDAREAVTSSMRTVWPPGVLQTFHRAHVISYPPVRLYDDLPEEVSPARPRS